MIIKEATLEDFDNIWPIFEEVVRAGETYAYPQNTSKEEAQKLWMEQPAKTFIVVDGSKVVGTYYIKTNQTGQGSHICNCGYMVDSTQRGKGIASMMCEHSLEVAKEMGYKGMQFNFVASSNIGAIRLWKKLGFVEVGRLPKAFNHPKKSLIDALVMYQWLGTK